MDKNSDSRKMTDIDYWLWLSLKKAMNASKMQRILQYFNSPKGVYDATREMLVSIRAFDNRTVSALADKRLDRVDQVKKLCKIYDIKVVTFDSPYYPENLKHIDAPPYVLYTRSSKRINLNEYIRIAMVGNRRATEYGKSIARKLSYDLANNGIVVVSGMAKGIDTSSHYGAIDAGYITVAVMGCGLHTAYPRENRELMEKIIETGIAISEYPPDSPPLAQHFPERNRIISGISQGTVVVEAPKRSGSLITANYAIDQDRDLFAVPGDINRERSEGANNLLKEYAVPVTSARDIIEYYSFEYSEIAKIREIQRTKGIEKQEEYKENEIIKSDIYKDLTEEEKHIITKLSQEPISFEKLMNLTEIPADKLTSLITMLEIKGKLKTLPGKNFTLNM